MSPNSYPSLASILKRLPRLFKLLKFLAAGLPGILIAVPLNAYLIAALGIPAWISYAAVLVIQVTVNFFACRWFVFSGNSSQSLWRQYFLFLNGILLFRILDWGLFTLLVTGCSLPFLPVQLFNVVLFSLFKFRYSEKLMERATP